MISLGLFSGFIGVFMHLAGLHLPEGYDKEGPPLELECWTYEVEIKDKVAGDIDVSREQIGPQSYRYEAKSSIRHQMVIPIKVFHKFSAIFERNLLKSARVHIEVNGRSHTDTKTLYQGYHVWHHSNGKSWQSIQETIDYSSILFYFQEPEGIEQVFSEEDGTFHPLQRIGVHSYMKISPKGRKNVYHYRNGVLVKAEIDTRSIDFIIRKV